MKRLSSIILLTVLTASFAQALPEDRDQPINISAESSRLMGDKTTRFTGNVIVTQGSTQINADQLTAYVVDNRTTKLIATGSPVRFQERPRANEPLTVGNANRLELDVEAQSIALIGNAYLSQDGKEMRADRIVHDSQSRLTTAGGGQERVNVILQPKRKDTTQQSDKTQKKDSN